MRVKLAIEGGPPVRSQPFAPWPWYGEDEIQAVQAVLASGKVNYWTGEEGRRFEAEYAAALGRRHAIAVMNGTVALELALVAFGIGPGDEVITTPRTFIASASCIVARGAKPVLADVDRDSGNVTVQTLDQAATAKTRAVIVVHLGGWPCDMPAIMDWAQSRGIRVIEDCAQAHGAAIAGKSAGAWGDAAAFSFCQDKIISTGGEGGLLVLDDEDAWLRAWAYKDHGKSYEAVYLREHQPGYRWLHETFGTNWRMTEMQAAIGRRQLTKLDDWVERRQSNAAMLAMAFGELPGLRLANVPPGIRHAYYRFYAYIDASLLRQGWTRDRVISAISAEGVPCYVGTCGEIYRELAFVRNHLVPDQSLPVARELGETSIAFLVHPTLEPGDMLDMANAALKVLKEAVR